MQLLLLLTEVLVSIETMPSDYTNYVQVETAQKDVPEAPEAKEVESAEEIPAPVEEVPAALLDSSESREAVQESLPVESEAIEVAPPVAEVPEITEASPSDDTSFEQVETAEKNVPEVPDAKEDDSAEKISAPVEEVPAALSDGSESREVVQECLPVESEAVELAAPVAEVPAVSDAIPSDEIPEVDFETNSEHVQTSQAAPTSGSLNDSEAPIVFPFVE